MNSPSFTVTGGSSGIDAIAALGNGTAGSTELVAVGWQGNQNGDDRRQAIWLYDGATWTRDPDMQTRGKTHEMYGVVGTSHGVVAVGYDRTFGSPSSSEVWISSDGKQWRSMPPPSTPGGGDVLCAVMPLGSAQLIAAGNCGKQASEQTEDAHVAIGTLH
jgi:hypothetical protein